MKKKLLKLASLIIIVILVFEIYTVGKTNKLYYVPLGDSIALGQNPYGETGYSYADYLKDYLKKHKKLSYYTKEYPKSGYTTENILSDIYNNPKLKKDLRESDLVTLSIGANDLLHKISFHDVEITKLLKLKAEVKKIIPNLNNCLREIRKYAKGKIIIVGYYNPIPFLFNTSGNDLDELFAYIDEEYNKLATKYNCEYISIYQLFKKNNSYLPNTSDIHPSLKGYKGIANEIIKKFTF